MTTTDRIVMSLLPTGTKLAKLRLPELRDNLRAVIHGYITENESLRERLRRAEADKELAVRRAVQNIELDLLSFLEIRRGT